VYEIVKKSFKKIQETKQSYLSSTNKLFELHEGVAPNQVWLPAIWNQYKRVYSDEKCPN